MRRRLILAVCLLVALGVAVALYAFAEARRDPVVRRAAVALPLWPAGQAPVRVVLVSDLHIGSPVMDAARLRRIVGQIDALRPDLVLIAGDFIYGERPDGAALHGPAMIAPLRALHARLGVFAVPGNHDHGTGIAAVARQVRAAGVTLLRNQAVQVGPLALGGIDDAVTHHARVLATANLTRRTPGARVLLSHTPDIAPWLSPDMTLLLAGHTHCGQIVLPLLGPLGEVSRPRYRCGIIRQRGNVVIVGAGVGTSVLPFRLGAPPDLWLLTLGPPARR